jgi:hypothetical protein
MLALGAVAVKSMAQRGCAPQPLAEIAAACASCRCHAHRCQKATHHPLSRTSRSTHPRWTLCGDQPASTMFSRSSGTWDSWHTMRPPQQLSRNGCVYRGMDFFDDGDSQRPHSVNAGCPAGALRVAVRCGSQAGQSVEVPGEVTLGPKAKCLGQSRQWTSRGGRAVLLPCRSGVIQWDIVVVIRRGTRLLNIGPGGASQRPMAQDLSWGATS